MPKQEGTALEAAPLGGTIPPEDIRVTLPNGRAWHLWGRGGAEREAELARSVPEDALPVLLGSGLGRCLELLAGRPAVVVVDRERAIQEASGARERFAGQENVHWLDGGAEAVLARVEALRREHGLTGVHALRLPLYQRLDREYYGALAARLQAMDAFTRTVRAPRFRSGQARVLLLRRPYFLYREIESALERLGMPVAVVEIPEEDAALGPFVERLLGQVAAFRPDFALTVNHFGLDREGHLAALLEDLGLPLASWFVDSPALILADYPTATPGTCVFTYDADNVDWLGGRGFSRAHYLPLATDERRFAPGGQVLEAWRARVSFVGDSMVAPVARLVEAAGLSARFRAALSEVARGFARSGEASPVHFLEAAYPELYAEWAAMADAEQRLACERGVTFAAAGSYRADCVRELLPFGPLVAGDEGWRQVLGPPGLRGEGNSGWRAHGPLEYYSELPRFYQCAEVNFNCTSAQMKGAVNQRVFDVPACGGFLVTDRREQLGALFDEAELACYGEPGEIGEVVARWLADPRGRERLAERARRRVLAEHTYERRVARLAGIMRDTFA
ncbi:MAG: glycosyltransferase [Desulfovibrionaceae bacterium]